MIRKIGISAGKILLFFGLWAAGIAATTLSVVHFGGPKFFENTGWRFAVEAGGMVAAFAALFIVAIFVDRRPVSTLGFPAHGAVTDLTRGALIGAAIFALPVGALAVMGYAHYAPDFSHFSMPALGLALLLVFVNVVDQELIVRSYLFQELWAKYSGAAAVIVSTIVFVGLHAAPISQGMMGKLVGLNILFASVMLGIAYLRSGALWLPIGIHFGWNGFQGPVLGINVTGMALGPHWHAFAVDGPALWTGGTMGVEGGLAGLAGPLLGIAIVLLFVRKRAVAQAL